MDIIPSLHRVHYKAIIPFMLCNKYVLSYYRTLLFFVACGLLLSAPILQAADWDNELRCCFKPEELKDQFIITLITNRPVSHLRLTAPDGKQSGFEPTVGKFYPPTARAIYASEPGSDWNIDDPEWHHFRNRYLVVRQLINGSYKLEVIGESDGQYFLSFYPAGFDKTKRSRLYALDPAQLKAGQTHIYEFPGKFANFTDHSIPFNSPDRFRVTRIK